MMVEEHWEEMENDLYEMAGIVKPASSVWDWGWTGVERRERRRMRVNSLRDCALVFKEFKEILSFASCSSLRDQSVTYRMKPSSQPQTNHCPLSTAALLELLN
jgi:hypothetical protein